MNNKKINYWSTKYGYMAFLLADDFSKQGFVTFINELYLSLKGDQAEYKVQGFVFDEAITNSTEFYCANQKHLRSLYTFSEVA
jgi:hypothetical protein